jgi:hypothetical protein
MTPDELPADMEDLKKWADGYALMNTDRIAGSVRDLLKAYQEQRRALERIVARTTPHPDDTLEDTAKGALKANAIARAALNQKGDER